MNEWMSTLLTLVYGQATLCAMMVAVFYLVLAWEAGLASSIGRSVALPWERWMLYAALGCHALLLSVTVWMPHQSGGIVLGLGFAQALSLVACVGGGLLALEERWIVIYPLRPVALLLPATAVLLGTVVSPVPILLSAGTALHVLSALAAHGVALLATGHALLLLSLSLSLKNGAPFNGDTWLVRLTRHSPPLVVLEQLLVRLAIWSAGLLAMTVGLGAWSGTLKFDHKTVLTLLSLGTWLAVAWGYEYRSWRGKRLCVGVWLATGLLLLAYIGSKFVLQAVLHRV